MSQGNSVTVDVSSGSKCHSGRNVGGHNVKAPEAMDYREINLYSAKLQRRVSRVSLKMFTTLRRRRKFFRIKYFHFAEFYAGHRGILRILVNILCESPLQNLES